MSPSSLFPLGAAVSLADLEGDVHPLLHRLRAAEPVSWLPAIGGWLVTRRDLCVAAMRAPDLYTVDHPGFSTAQVVGPSMLSLDGAEHVRHRSPFERPFRKGAVEHRFRRPVAARIEALLDDLLPAGRAELRRDFAGPVAVHAMVVALGLGEIPVAAVLGWYDAIVGAVTRVTAGEPVGAAGWAAFAALRNHLLPALRRPPESSLLAAAAGAASGLTEDEIISNAAVLLFGGIETTEGMIASGFYHLLTHPAVLAEALADPDLLPGVVEESLRLEPAAAVVDRYAVRETKLGGISIRANDLVRISLAAANRDPAVFPEPDRFDPHRDNLRAHVTFAQGPHVCLGLHLARLEGELALARALARLPGLRLVDPAAARPRGLVFRKPPALHVAWGA